MRFNETSLPGVFVIEPEFMRDERGFFARTFCTKEFDAQGLNSIFDQCSVSYNIKKGTVRGMHYQTAPDEEVKLVRCTKGAIFDVAVDPSSGNWFGVELSAANRKALYIPKGFAHGFQTLSDETEVFYQIAGVYRADSARGLRWNDPSLGITWPFEVSVISKRDQEYQLLTCEKKS